MVLLQIEGAQAVATSSAAMAWSLGYADGSRLPRSELIAAVRRIIRVAKVPVSVDIEDGYSNDADQVADLVLELTRHGVAGINLEDAQGEDIYLQKLYSIKNYLHKTLTNKMIELFFKNPDAIHE